MLSPVTYSSTVAPIIPSKKMSAGRPRAGSVTSSTTTAPDP